MGSSIMMQGARATAGASAIQDKRKKTDLEGKRKKKRKGGK